VGFKPGFGEGFMPSNSIDYEFFFGGQSNQYFGFELGFTSTPKINKYSTLYGGDYYPGAIRALEPGTWQTWQPEYDNFGFYCGINRYIQILSTGNLRGFGFVGLTYIDIHAATNFIADDLGVPSSGDINAALTTYDANKIITMIKLGLEQNFTPYIGWRFAYTWKNYAAFGKIHSLEYPDLPVAIMPKNTNALYLSVFLVF
jgi:hypothetical protein